MSHPAHRLSPRRTRPDARDAFPKLRDRYRVDRLPQGVSPICLGKGVADSDPRAICAAFDAGINFFFLSADLHWPLYESSRRGLELLFERPGVRDDVVVAVASYMTHPELAVRPHFEVVDAVKGLERVDLCVLGAVYEDELTRRVDGHAEQRSGAPPHVGPLGVTCHDRSVVVRAVNEELVDVAFVRYNPVHPGAEEDVFPHVRPDGRCLLYNFKSSLGCLPEERLVELGLAPEDWRPTPLDYFRFALEQPVVDGLLTAVDDERQVQGLEAALARGPLEADERQYLLDLASLDDGSMALER